MTGLLQDFSRIFRFSKEICMKPKTNWTVGIEGKFAKKSTRFSCQKGHILIRGNYSWYRSDLAKKFRILPDPKPQHWLCNRGLQFYTFFGISIWITWRMIDIGKKITFYFLQNVWKCTFFSHLHFKITKSAIMTQKKIFLKNINIGIKKTLISNSLLPAFRNAPNKS